MDKKLGRIGLAEPRPKRTIKQIAEAIRDATRRESESWDRYAAAQQERIKLEEELKEVALNG